MVGGGDLARVAKGAAKVARALLDNEGPAAGRQVLRLKEHGVGLTSSLRNVRPSLDCGCAVMMLDTEVFDRSPCCANFTNVLNRAGFVRVGRIYAVVPVCRVVRSLRVRSSASITDYLCLLMAIGGCSRPGLSPDCIRWQMADIVHSDSVTHTAVCCCIPGTVV